MIHEHTLAPTIFEIKLIKKSTKRHFNFATYRENVMKLLIKTPTSFFFSEILSF